ncbi:MAG: molybdenum cofactor guanylyltransferase [Colwellia sp.]|jgi:molybdopterin-guanine dinucleotide biosynthesis protein A|uniref:molybdenum cofactor guanylyltransferase n=1 Tax=uncultured Pseudoalteromonas sp. TaxID=114053 RepID=UPI000C11A2D5|nr:molybdenum cofactor guanylyltransferase [uncultured Pseudoalteromonas sp.]MBL1383260.1 molybdenum cofactor guanylyltransferase [Colwellia sp.]|tara:strand:+ start:3691 stop:4332 length:642 start_codon:yes stop_codon:yes gene_type:complete
MTVSHNNECVGVVLAGGLSSRMGQDKAQLVRNNNSMLAFSKQILADAGVTRIVVSGDNYDVPDTVKESGPVGGIASVLSRFPQAKSLLILPVDLPLMTASVLAKLRINGELSQKATHFAGHNIPLYLPNNAYVELFLKQAFSSKNVQSVSSTGANSDANISTNKNARFKNKGPSIKALLTQIPHQAIACSDAKMLFNTNTPDEWQQAKQQLNF